MIKTAKKIIEQLIYLFIFLLPLSTVWILAEKSISDFKWQEGTYLLYATEILLWFIFIGYFFISLKEKKFILAVRDFRVDKFRLKIIVLIWLFVFLAGLSIGWSGNQALSFYYWLKLAEGVILALIILNWRLDFSKLVYSLFFSGILQAGLAIGQFLTQKIMAFKWLGIAFHLPLETTASVIEINGERWLRAYGSFPHPNILGGFLAISFMAALYLYFNHRSGWKKILILTASLIIFIGLFFSFSRSAWLATFFASLVLFIFYGLKKCFREIINLLLYLGTILLILFFIYNSLTLTRLEFSQRLEIRSIERRIESVLEAKEIIASNWLVGVGLGNYTNYLIIMKPQAPGWSYQPAHNLYLLIMSELGLVGLFIFLALIWQSLLAAFKKFQQNPVYLSWLIIILIIGLFDHYFWTSYQGMILLMLILLLAFSNDQIISGNWNEAAKEYSQLIGERGDFVRGLIINPYLEDQLKLIEGGKILDLGCGEGYLSRVSLPSFQYTGVDSSNELLSEANYKKTQGQFIQADICGHIDLPPNSFEAVIANMVLMDVPDLKAAYANAYKFLKPGGLLIVTILHPVLGAPVGHWFKTLSKKFLRQEPFIRIDEYGREFAKETIMANLTKPTRVYHRPLSKYVQTALDLGLVLKNISEPMFNEADLVKFHKPKFLVKMPVVLALTFIKPN